MAASPRFIGCNVMLSLDPPKDGFAVANMTEKPVRIAMWSGPRNISTAMMRAWGNRADTVVIDEPFYAFYLNQTHADHPAADQVIAAGETDWRKVVSKLTGSIPQEACIFYQKQMAHHLLPLVSRDWLAQVLNCFLIRDPAEVIASYIKKNRDPEVTDLGFIQQLEIFDYVRKQTGNIPPVIDATDVLKRPEETLRMLCAAIGVKFDSAMLSWQPGLRQTDGLWAKYWYSEVAKSTAFQPYVCKQAVVPERLGQVYAYCRECYERLSQYRLQ